MGMGNAGFPSLPWNAHGNGNPMDGSWNGSDENGNAYYYCVPMKS